MLLRFANLDILLKSNYYDNFNKILNLLKLDYSNYSHNNLKI
jgi:hypothetical protein